MTAPGNATLTVHPVSDDRHSTSETVMDKIKFYVGLDVRKDSIAIAFAAALFTGRSSLRRHDPL
jgi:hypothetical protein